MSTHRNADHSRSGDIVVQLLSYLGGLEPDSSPRRTKRAQPRRPRREAPRVKPSVDTLEDRTLLSFLVPVNYAAGAGPLAVVSADFNGDGRLDLATANQISDNVSVLLGNPDGTFQPPLTSATSRGPISLVVGDFNKDGKLDLATANAVDVSVLLGSGDGTFQTPTSTSIGDAGDPASVAVGDFNADGKLDLGVTSNVYFPGTPNGPGYWVQGYYGAVYYPGAPGDPAYYEGRASVLLGNGDGSFSAPNTAYLGYGYHLPAAVADFNGDGNLDFASTTYDYNGTVDVVLGSGMGAFGSLIAFSVGSNSYPVSMAAGDVNADGKLDLVTANRYGNEVGVLLGDGLGGFGVQNFAVRSEPSSVVLGDFNHDAKVDIATANFIKNDVSVLYGRGDGTFSAAVISASSPGPYSIVAGDFNGDGWLDAATANPNENNVSVLINDRSWATPPAPTVSVDDVTVTEGNTGTVNATLTLTLSFASTVDVTVHYATADITAAAGSDYTAASGDVTIPAGQLSRTITVAVIGDRLAEATETFAVNLSATVNATLGDGQGIGSILDDEPWLSVNDVTVTEGNTGSVNATFTVSLSALSDVDVTVHYVTANGSATAGSDYTAKSADVVIPHGQLSRTITVAVIGDRLVEPTETFVVNLTAPLNAGVVDGQGVCAILDNEPRISIKGVAKKEGDGGTTQFLFTVTLSAAYDQTVTVNYATANGSATAGSDYHAKSGAVTFAPGVTSMTITIGVIADKVREADETFFVNLSGASSNALVSAAQGIGTILDDDAPARKKH
jgi:Calx-beta domain/FG-GAP-like repeat